MPTLITILAVRDLARSRDFYDAVFAWPIAVEAPNYIEYALPGGAAVGLYAREGYARNLGASIEAPRSELATTELYLRVPDAQATLDRLAAAGAAVFSPLRDRPWGERVAYGADPDLNVLGVAQA